MAFFTVQQKVIKKLQNSTIRFGATAGENLVFADNGAEKFAVVAARVVLDPLPKRLLDELEETRLDLHHVDLQSNDKNDSEAPTYRVAFHIQNQEGGVVLFHVKFLSRGLFEFAGGSVSSYVGRGRAKKPRLTSLLLQTTRIRVLSSVPAPLMESRRRSAKNRGRHLMLEAIARSALL